MVLIFWSFCIKAKGHTTDANGNKLRKEVYTDELILNGTLQDKTYRANTIRSSAQAPANSTVTLEGRDSVVIGPGSEILAGSEFTTRIDPTLVPVDQTDYIGGIEYRNGGIEAIYHPQGRAVPDGSTWRHEYVITDHLGNTRLRFSDLDGNGTIDSTELLSTHDYYPFGLEWDAGGYKYTYNGKEIDRELGLNWHHYGARMYDPVIARFTGVDPISDEFPWVNTYNYAENEPVANIDLHGLQKFNTTQYDSNKARMTSEEKKVFLQAQANALIEVADALVDELPLVGEVRAALEGDATGVLMAALFPGGRKLSKGLKRLKKGRSGKQARLKELAKDPKTGKADKGWIKSEMNQIERGKRKTIRNPPGKDLAHERGREAAKGYSYKHSNLQDRDLHRRQHKHDFGGRKNKERPTKEKENENNKKRNRERL